MFLINSICFSIDKFFRLLCMYAYDLLYYSQKFCAKFFWYAMTKNSIFNIISYSWAVFYFIGDLAIPLKKAIEVPL